MKTKKYGWLPDVPDRRDFRGLRLTVPRKLPDVVDLRKQYSLIPIFNQGNLGSCTANAISAAYMADYVLQYGPSPGKLIIPSRLFIYYNERDMEGSVRYDSGAYIRDGIKSLNKLGVCGENLWPYSPTRFRNKPSATCYKDALNHQVVSYDRLDNGQLSTLMGCLALGKPFVFGFAVYESFEEVGRNGLYNPKFQSEKLIGGHAVCAFGYDVKTRKFLVRNSWGKNWGDGGYFYMNFDEISDYNICDDFWVMNVIEK